MSERWGPGSEGGCEGGFLCQLVITPKHQEPSRQTLIKRAKALIQGTELPLSSMALLSQAFATLLTRATLSTFFPFTIQNSRSCTKYRLQFVPSCTNLNPQ